MRFLSSALPEFYAIQVDITDPKVRDEIRFLEGKEHLIVPDGAHTVDAWPVIGHANEEHNVVEKVTILKLDDSIAARVVINGIPYTISQANPRHFISMYIQSPRHSPEKVIAYLQELGFDLSVVEDDQIDVNDDIVTIPVGLPYKWMSFGDVIRDENGERRIYLNHADDSIYFIPKYSRVIVQDETMAGYRFKVYERSINSKPIYTDKTIHTHLAQADFAAKQWMDKNITDWRSPLWN